MEEEGDEGFLIGIFIYIRVFFVCLEYFRERKKREDGKVFSVRD